MFDDIGIEATCKSVSRLGARNKSAATEVKRLMKVVMQNEADNDLVMSRLSNLKRKEGYKGISVTDDHSVTDRKAEAANGNEPAESLYEWKVRGSRKNGMQLKKLRKRTPSA